MIGVQFHPVDTLFFRDGSPFTANETPQEYVGSMFPPYPPTMVGALRAMIARSNGWNGRGRWSQEICDILGDGPDDLGRVSFDGPFLLHCGEPLFRAPRHMLGEKRQKDCSGDNSGGWTPKAFLRPGDAVLCDLGNVYLPELDSPVSEPETLDSADNQWLTAKGMRAALRGKLPKAKEDVIPDSRLWKLEDRTGLKRCRKTRTAIDGMLYSARHIRPKADTTIGAHISGLPKSWADKLPFGQLTPLGGESRLAECQRWDANLGSKLPRARIQETKVETKKVALIALSPLDIRQDIHAGIELPSDIGNLRVVSACLDRPQRIGGWNTPVKRPLPIRSILPPGSVLFCELLDTEQFENADTDGLIRIGERTEWGFGLVALGVWPDKQQSQRDSEGKAEKSPPSTQHTERSRSNRSQRRREKEKQRRKKNRKNKK